MDVKKAVNTYHRNIAIILGIVLAIFIAIPLFVKTPYIINIKHFSKSTFRFAQFF